MYLAEFVLLRWASKVVDAASGDEVAGWLHRPMTGCTLLQLYPLLAESIQAAMTDELLSVVLSSVEEENSISLVAL